MTILKEADFRRQIKKTRRRDTSFRRGGLPEGSCCKAFAREICGVGRWPEFNYIRLCADEYSPKLLGVMAPLPMFGERKLVELFG